MKPFEGCNSEGGVDLLPKLLLSGFPKEKKDKLVPISHVIDVLHVLDLDDRVILFVATELADSVMSDLHPGMSKETLVRRLAKRLYQTRN